MEKERIPQFLIMTDCVLSFQLKRDLNIHLNKSPPPFCGKILSKISTTNHSLIILIYLNLI